MIFEYLIMIELDSKLLDQFKGYVVRKDVVRSVKGGANVPVFVLEYLLANSCSTDNEEKIQDGIESVKRVLREHYVNPDEATLVQAKIRERGTYKIIDKISVVLTLQKISIGQKCQTLPSMMLISQKRLSVSMRR